MTRVLVTRARTNGMAPDAGLLEAMRMIWGGSWDSSTQYTSLIQMKIHEHVFTGLGGGFVELNVKVTVHYLHLGLEDLRVLLLGHSHCHPLLIHLRLRLCLATNWPHDLGRSSPTSWCPSSAGFTSHPCCSLVGVLFCCLHRCVLLIGEGHGHHWLPGLPLVTFGHSQRTDPRCGGWHWRGHCLQWGHCLLHLWHSRVLQKFKQRGQALVHHLPHLAGYASIER